MIYRHMSGGSPPRRLRAILVSGMALGSSLAIAPAQGAPVDSPFTLERAVTMPEVPPGPYSDYLALDAAGNRLFATPQAAKAVAVLDLGSGRVLKMISGIGNSHGIYYSASLKRLFVADGASGDVKVFSGENYSLLKTIPVARGADWLTFDSKSRFIYVNNGGEDAGMDHSLISAISTESLEKIADITIRTAGLEASVIDSDKELLYVNLVDDGAVAVVDLTKRNVIANWKLPGGGHRNMAIALDSRRGRIYVACRDSAMHGSIVVLDTADGRQVATLPIGGWADGIFVDQQRQRIYVSTGVGHLETYGIEAHDVYRRLEPVDTAVMAKTGIYTSELDRMYVSVPHLGGTPAQVMIFKPTP
ncbi:MAG: Pyrrolo-quinoline quinone beta-propeller repeat-containing protein [Gammaproteobacteria bacterium]|nr:Pyrrolo-quinoline quinone beta-propeller repeat-containing protein [Gammaproteobacteria bacterium]